MATKLGPTDIDKTLHIGHQYDMYRYSPKCMVVLFDLTDVSSDSSGQQHTSSEDVCVQYVCLVCEFMKRLHALMDVYAIDSIYW